MSQHFFDPYSFCHILHGFIFFGLWGWWPELGKTTSTFYHLVNLFELLSLGLCLVVGMAGGGSSCLVGWAGPWDHWEQRVGDPVVQGQQWDQWAVWGGQHPKHYWGPNISPFWLVCHCSAAHGRIPLVGGCLDSHIWGLPHLVHEGLWTLYLHSTDMSHQGINAS